MLTREDDVDAHALRRQGWTITAIAKHLGHDRKTIRSYLAGDRVAGQRASSHPDPLGPFLAYATRRLLDDPHVWGTTLFDEVVKLGYPTHERSIVMFCGVVLGELLQPFVRQEHRFRLPKADGAQTRNEARFANLEIEHEGRIVRAGLAYSYAQQGLPLGAYGAECAARYEH